jgi:hypothetical protein
MKTQKNLGVWMDHSTANLIYLNSNKHSQILSEFTFETKEEALIRSENVMHNKRQQMHAAYYKNIADAILIMYFYLVQQMQKQNYTIT